jgi:hypothetical protein
MRRASLILKRLQPSSVDGRPANAVRAVGRTAGIMRRFLPRYVCCADGSPRGLWHAAHSGENPRIDHGLSG